jgi:hypothetical protein
MAQNPFYVYALKDPRQKPAKPFYIGKGTGNRAWEHQTQVDEFDKGKVIQAIHDDGLNVLHTVISDNLTEEQALKIEAELISAFGIISQGGLLTNKVRPNTENISTSHLKKVFCPKLCVNPPLKSSTYFSMPAVPNSDMP